MTKRVSLYFILYRFWSRFGIRFPLGSTTGVCGARQFLWPFHWWNVPSGSKEHTSAYDCDRADAIAWCDDSCGSDPKCGKRSPFSQLSFLCPMILPLLGRAGMQFLLGEEKIWNKCGEFFRRRRKELDEFTGYVVGALQPIVLAVYRVLCPHLFCKFSDDLKGMLWICDIILCRKDPVFPAHHMADADTDIHLYDRIFRDEYVQMLQEGVSSWWKISGW